MRKEEENTDVTSPSMYSSGTSIMFPEASLALLIWNTARMDAIAIQTELSAMDLPAQALMDVTFVSIYAGGDKAKLDD